jgi:hypothetical protein
MQSIIEIINIDMIEYLVFGSHCSFAETLNITIHGKKPPIPLAQQCNQCIVFSVA